jgi:histidine ammonia-lyase
VGACGDLAPLAQMALLLMGEGEAFYKGERLPGSEAMRRPGFLFQVCKHAMGWRPSTARTC